MGSGSRGETGIVTVRISPSHSIFTFDLHRLPDQVDRWTPDLRPVRPGLPSPLLIPKDVDDPGAGSDRPVDEVGVEIRMLRAQGGVEGLDEGEGGGFAVFQGVVDGLPLDVGAGLHQGTDFGMLLEPEPQADRRHRRRFHHDDSLVRRVGRMTDPTA
jgi:hypothetical protein